MESIKPLQERIPSLLAWYRATARPLPWRCPPTPYRVWVSEVMLQQTRIEAVIPYFERFMTALPTVADLAKVPDDRLMKLWEGLGYYSRARNLKKAAQQICEQHNGVLPASYEALLQLPGLGEYTAGAVASIAFGVPQPAVDGNVLRVMARLTADFEDVMQTATRRRHTEIVRSLIPADTPGEFNAALMELGERICLPNTTPRCEECPLSASCCGYHQKVAVLLPVRGGKKARRIEARRVVLLISDESTPRVLLHKRPSSGLLAGLWELPNSDLLSAEEIAGGLCSDVVSTRAVGEGIHRFSHVEWHMSGTAFWVRWFLPPVNYTWASLEDIQGVYALPTAFRPFSRLLPILLKRGADNE